MNRMWAGLLAAVVVVMMASCAQAMAAPKPPWINAGFADRPVEPTEFGPGLENRRPNALTYTGIGNYVRRISWSSWGGDEAIGKGRVSLLRGTYQEEDSYAQPEETSPVSVRLGGLRKCLGVEVYTTYSLKLDDGAEAPLGWPRGQSGTFPCDPVRSSYYDGDPSYGSKCVYYGMQAPFGPVNRGSAFEQPEWRPHVPFQHVRTWVFCNLRASDWGASRATVTGVALALLHPFEQDRTWPAKLDFQDPIWCPSAAAESGWPEAAAVTYGSIRLTTYGTGPEWPLGAKLPKPRLVGVRHVYWEHIDPRPEECLIGMDQRNPRFSPKGAHY